jgi:hypothetical protein
MRLAAAKVQLWEPRWACELRWELQWAPRWALQRELRGER